MSGLGGELGCLMFSPIKIQKSCEPEKKTQTVFCLLKTGISKALKKHGGFQLSIKIKKYKYLKANIQQKKKVDYLKQGFQKP